MTEPTCKAQLIIPLHALWTFVPLLVECGAPAPNHGVTMYEDGVSLGRKPICDDHHKALQEQMGQ